MKSFCLSLLLLASANYSFAQSCIEAEINGPLCPFCAPPGWDIQSGSPDTGQDGVGVGGCTPPCCIVDFLGSQSLDGGTAALFQGGDAITINIGGLTPGMCYAIGFEWTTVAWDCPIGGWDTNPNAQMEFTVNGSSDILDWSGSGWDTYIVCFTASSSSVDVVVEHLLFAGDVCVTAVDYIPCWAIDPSQFCGNCCSLIVELNDDVELCPDEVFTITGDYFNEVGSTNITWECTPPEGLNYLDDLSSPNPNFLFPDLGDFDGETFEFSFIVEDDACIRSDEIIIEVLPSQEPVFDFFLCESDDLSVLPTESDNNYNGTWTGPTNFDLLAGTSANFTFEINPNQNNCFEELNVDIFINENLVPDFSLLTEYCVTETDPIILPATSDNNIDGIWDVNNFTPNLLGTGYHTFYFEAVNELCYEIYELEIEITDGLTPIFTLPDQLCSSELPFVFPTSSENSYDGTWSNPSIDEVFNDFETISSTFTPNSTDCVTELEVEILVALNQIPSFNLESSYCQLDEIIVPSEISNEGYWGTWDPPIIDPSSITSNSIEIQWTPDDLNDCVEEIILDIEIEAELLYGFNQPNLFCTDEVYVFPTISDNGFVTGSWFYPDLASLPGTGNYTNIFFPDFPLCASSIVFEFELVDEQIPDFDLPNYLCADSENLILPTASINNLEGSWNINEINVQSSIGQTIGVLFTPDDPNCSNIFEQTIEVLNPISLNFNVLPPSDCNSTDGLIQIINSSLNLNYSIDNGASWQVEDNFMNLPAANYTLLAQYNFAPECIQAFPINVQSLDNPQVDITNQSNNTNCNNPNGSIVLTSFSTEAVEYSIDGGTTWQDNPTFENLDGGSYTIIVRFVAAPSCTSLQTVFLEQATLPIIEDVIVSPVSDCLSANGSLFVESSTDLIEYSIDGGITWQENPSFENLEDGVYNIVIRLIGSEDCLAQTVESIDALMVPEIVSTDFNDPTDCGLEDGFYIIEATGIDLIYSIDGGITWSQESTFNNLSAGDYEIIISSSSFINCELYHPFSLAAPNQATIDMLLASNPTSCQENIGQIEIIGASSNMEFSIDGGITWQDENIFEQLTAGDYEIIIRDQDAPSCFIVEEINLFAEASDLEMIPFTTNNPSECMLSDGSIEFENNTALELSFSIDGGIVYQESPIFGNLPAGTYEVLVALNNNEDCNYETTIVLVDPDCPCDEFELMYDVVDASCNLSDLGEIHIFLEGDETISWTNNLIGTSVDNLETGWYFFTIIYDNGNCEHLDSIFVNEIQGIDFDVNAFPTDCIDVSNGSLLVQNISGGSGNYQLSIDGENFQTANQFDNLSTGVFELLVQDDNACTATEQIEIEANRLVTINMIDEIIIQSGDTVILEPILDTAGITIDSFSWNPSNGILNPDDLSILVTPEENTSYELTIYFGECSVSSFVIILVEETEVIIDENEIYLPNVIEASSENNNSFYIQGNEFTEVQLMVIYDRWGNRVFYLEEPEINNPLSGWIPDNGLEVGVYVYLIEIVENNQIVPLIGTVTHLK